MNDSSPERFFDRLRSLLTETVPPVFVLAGTSVVRLNFSGQVLRNRMMRALSHLVTDERTPELTIQCIENPSLQKFPWDDQAYGAQGAVDSFCNERFQTAYQFGGGAVMMYDRELREGIYWIDAITNIPYWEISFPFRTIFHWWSRDTDYQLLHSAGIGLGEMSMLLTGKSGSGKSSTTLSCLLHDDLRIAGDDYVLVNVASSTLYSLYNCAKVERDNLKRLRYLDGSLDTSINAEKAMIFLDELYTEKLLPVSKLEFCLIPFISNSNKTTIEPCGNAEIVKSLAPTTMFQLPFGQTDTFSKCAVLARKLRSYRINLGIEPAEIADAIAEFFQTSCQTK